MYRHAERRFDMLQKEKEDGKRVAARKITNMSLHNRKETSTHVNTVPPKLTKRRNV